MRASPVTAFAAGFVAGGIALGGFLAHARIVTMNASVAGVLPNSGGSLFCVTAGSQLRAIVGTSRSVAVGDGKGGTSMGVELRCAP